MVYTAGIVYAAYIMQPISPNLHQKYILPKIEILYKNRIFSLTNFGQKASVYTFFNSMQEPGWIH